MKPPHRGATPALEARLDVALELPHRGSKRPPQASPPLCAACEERCRKSAGGFGRLVGS